MKFNWDKKYLFWGVTAFCVIVASVLFAFLIFQMGTIRDGISKVISVLNPLIYGAIIAYLLNPILKTIEKLVYSFCNKKGWAIPKRVRSLIRLGGIIISLVFAVLCIYGLLALLIPEVINSISNLVDNFPRYAENLLYWLTATFNDNEAWDQRALMLFEKVYEMAQNWLTNDFMPYLNAIISNLYSGVFDILIFLKNILIGALISIYILYGKESFAARAKRITYAVFGISLANKTIHNLRFVDDKFGSFIIGKIIDSAIIGVLCYIGTSLIGTPYSLLISVIVGVTNVIPFFGPFLGAIPCAFLILAVNPMQCLYFVLFVFVLQQLDGNFIGPKILGDSTGVSSFMVIVAILVGGGFFGVFGMFVGVPVCAVIIAIAQAWMDRRIEEKHLPPDLEPYMNMEGINPKTMEVIPWQKKKSGESKLYRETKEERQEKQMRRAKRFAEADLQDGKSEDSSSEVK